MRAHQQLRRLEAAGQTLGVQHGPRRRGGERAAVPFGIAVGLLVGRVGVVGAAPRGAELGPVRREPVQVDGAPRGGLLRLSLAHDYPPVLLPPFPKSAFDIARYSRHLENSLSSFSSRLCLVGS